MNSEIAKYRISEVVKPDSITTNEDDFLATHVPVQKLQILDHFEQYPPKNEKNEHSEQEVYDQYIKNPGDHHQFIAVYGISGTGKSHLIRWFKTKYEHDKDENEVIVFIRRSDNTLKGTIRQLLNVPEVSHLANKDIYQKLTRASEPMPEKKLKDLIFYNFITEIQNCDDTSILPKMKKGRLLAFLKNSLVMQKMTSNDGPISRIYSKIDSSSDTVDRDTIAEFRKEDFYLNQDAFEELKMNADKKAIRMANELVAEAARDDTAEKIAKYMNQFVDTVIQRCAGIEPGDFRGLFQDIRKELKKEGKRLTIFIEDITSFTGVDDALLDALMESHEGLEGENTKMCRISSIVGGTSSYLQNNFRANHKDRITKCIYLPDALFDYNQLYVFVAKYLNTMSLTHEELKNWVDHGALADQYPVAEEKEGRNWEHIVLDNQIRLSLYPFTKRAIINIYNQLPEGHKTPRYIIRDLIEKTVNEVLYEPNDFPSDYYSMTNDAMSYYIHQRISDVDEANRLARFICVWGTGKDETYEKNGKKYIAGIISDAFDDFNFPKIEFSQADAPSVSEEKNKPIAVSSNQNVKEKVTSKTQPEKNKDFEEISKALDEWIKSGKITIANVGIPKYFLDARKTICDFIYYSINWQSEGISMNVVEAFKDSRKMLIGFKGETKGESFIQLKPEWESKQFILSVINYNELGKKSFSYSEGGFDAYIISTWIAKNKSNIIETVRDEKRGQYSYIDFALAIMGYKIILNGELSNSSSLKSLNAKKILSNYTEINTNNHHSKKWNDVLNLMNSGRTHETNIKNIYQDIRQYFSLQQGYKISTLVINENKLNKEISKIRKKSLNLPIDKYNDLGVINRNKIFDLYNDINERIIEVAKEEQEISIKELDKFLDFMDITDYEEIENIDSDDIDEAVGIIEDFFNSVESAQINVRIPDITFLKNNSSKISKSVLTLYSIKQTDQTQTLEVIFKAGNDPLSYVQKANEIFEQIDDLLEKVKIKFQKKEEELDDDMFRKDITDYSSEKRIIESDFNKIEEMGNLDD